MQQGSDILTWIKKPYVQISHGFLFPTGWALHLWGSTAVARELSFILSLHFDMCSPTAPALERGLERRFATAKHIAARDVVYLFQLQRWNIQGLLLFPPYQIPVKRWEFLTFTNPPVHRCLFWCTFVSLKIIWCPESVNLFLIIPWNTSRGVLREDCLFLTWTLPVTPFISFKTLSGFVA